MVSTLKSSTMAQLPVGVGTYTIGRLFKTISVDSLIEIVLEWEDFVAAFDVCTSLVAEHFDPADCASATWKEIFQEVKTRGITGTIRQWSE
jgi:hypothetical protein